MEILPHFWIHYYNNEGKLKIIKNKKINTIIHLSKNNSFLKNNSDIEEIRIPIDYNDSNSYEEQNNIMYQYLFDITDFIHNKITNNEKILLIGEDQKQDLDTIIVAYFIRYGRMTIYNSTIYLKTKKKNVFEPKCLFYASLNKFYEEVNKEYK
jgi:protein-tyrosine phosphatase